jgi:hypothetical protein
MALLILSKYCLLREAGKCYRTRNEAEKHLIDDYKKLREM